MKGNDRRRDDKRLAECNIRGRGSQSHSIGSNSLSGLSQCFVLCQKYGIMHKVARVGVFMSFYAWMRPLLGNVRQTKGRGFPPTSWNSPYWEIFPLRWASALICLRDLFQR